MNDKREWYSKCDTDYLRDNMIFNYCLGNECDLLLRSYILNNNIDIRFISDHFYFFMTGIHHNLAGHIPPAIFSNGRKLTDQTYQTVQDIFLKEHYCGNCFQIKVDNSKRFGVIFSPLKNAVLKPADMAVTLKHIYSSIDPISCYSTSFVGPYSGYEQIHQAFLDARELNDLIFFGVRGIVITKAYKEKTARPCDVTAILGNVRRLTTAVCTGTLSQALRQADYIIRDLVAPSYAMGNFSALFAAVDDLLGMLETVYPDHIRITRRAQDTFFTLDDYHAWLRETLTAVFAQLRGVPRYSPTLLMALSYINRNYARELSLTQLSEYVYANASTLSTEFNNEVGMSLSEYVTGLRVRRAQELLKTTNLTVPQIAEAVGFSGAKYFREIFKKQTGQSPQGYRDGREL